MITPKQTEDALNEIMDGKATGAQIGTSSSQNTLSLFLLLQIGSFLTALKLDKCTPEIVAAAARVCMILCNYLIGHLF